MENLIGKTFGHLTVVSLVSKSRNGFGGKWLCKCVCGSLVEFRGNLLRVKKPHNCGCQTKRLKHEAHLKHGQAQKGNRSQEYRSWYSMKQRCLNPNSRGYPNYGAAGVKICQRWIDSFEEFFADMGVAPEGYQLDLGTPNFSDRAIS